MMEIESQQKSSVGGKLEERYQKLKTLGEGTYGQVFQCKDKETKEIIALKQIKLEIFAGDGFPSSSMREISILNKLKHPNIVNLKEIQFQQESNCLSMAFECLEGDLKHYLEKDWPLSTFKVKNIMKQILQGVEYCHRNQVMHRDLKPQNILTQMKGSNLEVKISDFGLARTFQTPQERYTKEIATLWYRAPEIMLGDDSYSVTIDIWAIGCIFVELLTKKPPFHAQSQIDQIFEIFKVFGTPNENTYPGVSKLPDFNEKFPKFTAAGIQKLLPSGFSDYKAIDLLQKLLALDPHKRIFCCQALKHPYFEDLNN